MKLPLANRLKKRLQLETALLQDEIVALVYELQEKGVLHGGTAVWRCYGGNRFSEDLDFYFAKFAGFEEKLREKVSQRGLQLVKFRQTENAIYSKICLNGVEVRLEAALARESLARPVARAFEKADGSLMDVLTLSPEGLLLEKVLAYENRKLARDLYDVYHLSRLADLRQVRPALEKLLAKETLPLDAGSLPALVYQGAVPSSRQMLEYLQGLV